MSYDVTIRRLDPVALLVLRGEAGAVASWLAGLGLTLPEMPNTAVRVGARELYWLGSTHWILRAPIADEDGLLDTLRAEDVPPEISQVLVTDAYALFEISGPDAAQVLAVASPLDLHPSTFPPNGATFTEAFGLKALVVKRDHGAELAVERSFGDMTADYLARVTDT